MPFHMAECVLAKNYPDMKIPVKNYRCIQICDDKECKERGTELMRKKNTVVIKQRDEWSGFA